MRAFVLIMSCLLSSVALAATPPAIKEPPVPQQTKIYFPEIGASLYPYDEETYTLAYQAFLAHKNIKSAYVVAYAAVKQQPKNIEWRARLAQVAVWNGKLHTALKEYQILLFDLHARHYLPAAMDLAESIGALDVLSKFWALRLKEGPLNTDEKYRYAKFQEQSGNVNEAVALYSELYQKTRKPEDLTRLSELEYARGNVSTSTKHLHASLNAQHNEANVLKLAQILYQEGKYPDALKVLKLIENDSMPKSEIYWITLGEIAWTLEDNAAKNALEHLAKNPTVSHNNLYRLAILLQKTEPNRAIHFAKLAWQKNQNSTLFIFIIDLLSQGKQWDSFQAFLQAAPKAIVLEAEKQVYFWVMKSEYFMAKNQYEAALQNYFTAIQKFPNNTDLKLGVINVMVKTRNWPEFLKYADLWYSQLEHKNDFADALKNYLDETGQKRAALLIWVNQFERNKKNPIWLNELSDALNLLGYTEIAGDLQQHLWNWIQDIHWRKNVEFVQVYAQLALARSIGDTSWQAAQYNLNHNTPLAGDIAISAALTQDNYPAAAFIANNWYASPNLAPKWAQMAMAYHQDDRPAMARLLQDPYTLQIRDRVNALRRLGDNIAAKKLAYEGLVQTPNDVKLYHILTDLMVETSSFNHFETLYFTVGTFGGPNGRWENRTVLSNRWFLLPRINYWEINHRDVQQMRNIPSRLAQFQLKLRENNRHGFNSFRVALNAAWQNYVGATWETEYIMRHDLTATVRIEAHEPNLDTNALIVAGMQNYLNLKLNYILTASNIFEIEGGAGKILDQRNQFLSNKYSLDASIIHRLIELNSNITLAPFFGDYQYNATHHLPTYLDQFVPLNQTPEVSFFIPITFYQYGLRLAWNDEWRFAYRARWEPYFGSEILKNSVSGFGYAVEAGISGRVFGRDSLHLFALHSKNSNGQNQDIFMFGLKYTYYMDFI